MLIVAPSDDDEVLFQCSALSDQETGSLCSDTEALSVDDAANNRVASLSKLDPPGSSTGPCTCRGVGADGRTREERCSLQMPQRSSLRSSSASSFHASEDGRSSCGMSGTSQRSVKFSDELQVASRARPMPWARCLACTEATRLDPGKDQVQDEFSWWGLLSFGPSWTGGSDRDKQQQQSGPGRQGSDAKVPGAPDRTFNGNMKQQQDPCIKAAPVRTFKLHIDCSAPEFSTVSSEAPPPSSAPPPAAPCARPPHRHHQLHKHHATPIKSNGGRVRGRMTMCVLSSLADDFTAHKKGTEDRNAKILRRSMKTSTFL